MSFTSLRLRTRPSMASARSTVISISRVMSKSKIQKQEPLNILDLNIVILQLNMVSMNALCFIAYISQSSLAGLRIMAFGVLFDFTGNSNVSKVIKTADLVKESWFLDAIKFEKPIDLFVVIGHNPVRTTAKTSTFGTLYKTIRDLRPDVPIQAFGGHTHIR